MSQGFGQDTKINNSIKECKLDDGRILEYHLCNDSPFIDYPGKYRYLGHGVIFRVNGVLQESKIESYFWRYRND